MRNGIQPSFFLFASRVFDTPPLLTAAKRTTQSKYTAMEVPTNGIVATKVCQHKASSGQSKTNLSNVTKGITLLR